MQPKKSNFQGAVDFAMEFTEETSDTFLQNNGILLHES